MTGAFTGAVASLVGEELLAPAPPQAVAFATRLLDRFETPLAVLFYGSILRTGDLDGVLDFYVLTERVRPGLRGLATQAAVAGRQLSASWRWTVRCCGLRSRP